MIKTPIDLSVGYQNIEGLHSRTFDCKLSYIQPKLIHDIEVLSETWGICNHSKDFPGYKTVHIDSTKKSNVHKGRSSGGILIYIKNHLFRFIKSVEKTPQYVWLEIDKSIFYALEDSIRICVAYNPPSSSKYCNPEIYDEISTHIMQCVTSKILLIGDFNSRTGETLEYTEPDKMDENEIPRECIPTSRKNCDKVTNPMGEKLIDLCKGHDLQLLNGRTSGDTQGAFTFYDTKEGASTIDVAVSSDPLYSSIRSFNVCRQDEFSKHCKIVVRIKNLRADLSTVTETEDTYPWIPVSKNYKWNEEYSLNFTRTLLSTEMADKVQECTQYLDAGLVEPAAGKIEELFIKTADIVLDEVRETRERHPFKHKQKPKKWYDKECRDLKNIVRKYAILKQQNPTSSNTRKQHSEALKEYKKLCASKKAIFEENQIRRLEELTSDPTEFWKNWKYFGDSYKTSNPTEVDGKKWETYFARLYQNSNTSTALPNNLSTTDDDESLNASYSIEELDHVIDKLLKRGKAAGRDRIKAEFLKAAPKEIRELLLRLLNLIFRTNVVPKSWCIGILNLIHKEGSKDNPDNYRGICIGSALSKTLSTMMNVRLTKFVSERNILHKEQIGFTEKNRAPDHILTIRAITNKYVQDNGSRVYSCFIDFKKAFDTVWHEGLFHKLQQMGASGNFLRTLRNIYKNTQCAVKIGDKLTNFFPCKQGVRQGDPLSPLLFNIFINDIFTRLREANCDPVSLDGTNNISALAYADDIVLLSTTKEGLQKAIDTVQKYCEEWKLKMNNSKTKTMIFSRGNQKINCSFNINGVPLENTKEYKYLGIPVHKKNCSFNTALKYLRTKATRALFALRSKVSISKLPIHIALKLFDSIIKPILLYASEVWEPFVNNEPDQWDKNDVERIYLQFLKQVLGVNRSATTAMVRGELNRHSLQEEILRRNINYAQYIHGKDNSCIVKQAYISELSRAPEKVTFFSTMMKHTEEIHTISKSNFHPYADPFLNLYLTNKLRQVTAEVFSRKWKEKLQESKKADTYRTFKTNMKFETYLTHPKRKERVALTKLRISDHKLMIEKGRHIHPTIPREERKCHMCTDKIEDEVHFLTDCKLYGSQINFWAQVSTKFPQTRNLNKEDKYTFIMTQEDPEIMELLLKTNYERQRLRNFLCEYFYQ